MLSRFVEKNSISPYSILLWQVHQRLMDLHPCDKQQETSTSQEGDIGGRNAFPDHAPILACYTIELASPSSQNP